MPISSFTIVPAIACELNYYKPKSVLDLGCGNGFYGAVVRTFVDMGVGNVTRIVGVEGFPQYEFDNLGWHHYSFVRRGTIADYLAGSVENFDAILFLDVIEHMPANEGMALLETLKGRLNPGGILLVSTPGIFVAQGAEYGNELEKHVSFYDDGDFTAKGFVLLRSGIRADYYNQRMTIAKYTK